MRPPRLNADQPVSAIEIDLTPPDAMRRLQGLGLDFLELREGYRGLVLGWPNTEQILNEAGLCYSVVSENYGRELVERSRAEGIASVASSGGGVPAFGSGSLAGFWTYDEVYALLDSVACDTSLVVGPDTLGFSLEGRPILGVGVFNQSQAAGTRPEVLLTALTHAREPMSMQTILFYMQELLDNYGTDPQITYLLDNREIWFVPIVNPDGYVRNQDTYDMSGSFGFWRKNLRDNDGNLTIDGNDGVDLNRNFGYEWGYDNQGSSPSLSSPTYRGPSAFSEPETQVLRDFCAGHSFVTANNYHSYYELVIYPWGHIPQSSPDSSLFEPLANAVTQDNRYGYGYGDEVLYPVNGDADDWMYGDEVTKPKIFAMTSEVGRLDDGFWPNQSRILPLASENLTANLALSYGADVYLRAGELSVNSASGYISPGEVRALSLELLHIGVAGTTTGGVTVKLSTSDPNLTFPDDTALYPDLSSSGTAWPLTGDFFQAVLSPSAVPGSEVLIDVEITDGAGYYGKDQVSFRVSEPVVVFSDDAESGLLNWSASGGFGTETLKGSTWFSDSPGSNYSNSGDARLTLNFGLDLTGGTHAFLAFDLLYNIEGGYDWAVVEASTDGGANWNALPGKHTVLGESSSGSYGGTVQQVGQPGYEMNRKVVVHEEIDLASVVGQNNVLLRFRMVSDGGLNQDGIQMDNLEVRVYAPSSLSTPPKDAATALRLLPPAPNPFQEETRIIYSVPRSMPVSVSVYDVSGRRIRTLAEGLSAPGEKSLVWDGTSGLGREVSAGIYYVRIDTPDESISKKVTVVQ